MDRTQMLRCSGYGLAVLIASGIGGCDRSVGNDNGPSTSQNSTQAKPGTAQSDSVEILRSSARDIVSEPSNWKSNGRQMARLIEASSRIGWADRAEMKQFKADVLDMMVFSTTWIEQVDETGRQSLAEELKKVQGQVSGAISPIGPVATGSISGEAQAKATNSEFIQTIQKLTKLKEEQAKHFGEVYAKLLTSYELLLKALDNKNSDAGGHCCGQRSLTLAAFMARVFRPGGAVPAQSARPSERVPLS